MAHTGTAHFLAVARPRGSAVHRLDARAKILGLIGFTVVVVTTPGSAVWAFVLYAAVLAFLVGLARLPLGYVLKRALIVIPFVVVVAIFIPFFHKSGAGGYSIGGARVTTEGLLVLWNAGAKAVLGVLSVIVLGSTTSFPDMVSGFERLRAPKVFILIVSFMYRYSFVFVEELRRMQRAMASRNYRARWLWNVPTLGRMLSALFLRSYNRGERVYVAMLSRGYEGTVGKLGGSPFRATDTLFLFVLLGTAVAIRVFSSF